MDERQTIAAANDNDFHASRHRTLPILASVTPIANYPTKLRIFKTNASRYWQVRCFIKGRTYTHSLKTTNKQAAISQAKHFFHIKVADLYGEYVRDRIDEPNKFAELVQTALAFQQVSATYWVRKRSAPLDPKANVIQQLHTVLPRSAGGH